MLIVKLGKKVTRFVLAVVPGDSRGDMGKIRSLIGATYVGSAAADVAQRLAGSVADTALRFAFHPDLTLIADSSLQAHAEIFFNAAYLDRSIVLRTTDYLAFATPRLEQIASSDSPAAVNRVAL